MKNGITYFKYGVILICVIAVMLLFRGCWCNKPSGKPSGKDTIRIKADTVYLQSKTDTQYIPAPYKVTQVITHYKTDTLETYELKVDTLKSVKDFLSTKYYRDTTRLKDQSGYIILQDTVSRNKIIGRGIQAFITQKQITNTVTLSATKRTTLYVGINAAGNKENTIYAVGGSLGIMAKNGKYYGAIVQLTKSGQPMYGAQILLPVRLRKQ